MAWNQVNARSCSPVSSATWPRKRSRWPSWLVQWQSSQRTITARWVGSCVLHGLLGLWMEAQLQSSMPCRLRSWTVSLPSWRGELRLVLRGLLCLWIEAKLQSSTPCRLRSWAVSQPTIMARWVESCVLTALSVVAGGTTSKQHTFPAEELNSQPATTQTGEVCWDGITVVVLRSLDLQRTWQDNVYIRLFLPTLWHMEMWQISFFFFFF